MAKTASDRAKSLETTGPKESSAAAPKDDDIKRLSFALTADGKRIDWTKVRESRRPEIEKLLADDPKVRAIVTPLGSGNASVPIANKALTDSIVDMLGQLEAALAVRMYGLTIDEALTVCQFSPAEKTSLSDPLERVLNKYGSTVLLKYGDELALAVLLLSYSRAKLASASVLAQGKAERRGNVNSESVKSS